MNPASDRPRGLGAARVLAVLGRELRAYFDALIAYVIILTFYAASAYVTLESLFASRQADLRGFFAFLPIGFLFLAPALAMRLWSEERKLGTMELLFTWPLRAWEIVLGKFLAGLTVLAAALALTLALAVFAARYGPLDPGPVIGGYVAALLLGGAYLALACFVSSLTENQVVAFVVSVFLSTGLFLAGLPQALRQIPPELTLFEGSALMLDLDLSSLTESLSAIGMGARFESVARGVLAIGDLAFYLCLIGLFLALNARAVTWRSLAEQAGIDGPRRWLIRLVLAPPLILAALRLWPAAALALVLALVLVAVLCPRGKGRALSRYLDRIGAAALGVVIALQASALADRVRWRKDLTQEGRFSLSPTSKAVLAGLEDPLEIRCYISGRLPPSMELHRSLVLDLLAEYATASNGRLRLRILDPDSDPGARERAEAEGLEQQTRRIGGAEDQRLIKRYFGCVVEYRERRELFQYLPDPRGLEYQMTSVIRGLELDKAGAIGVLSWSAQPSGGLSEVCRQARLRGLTVLDIQPEKLDAGSPVPDEVQILIVHNPEEASERAAFELDQFLMRGKSAIILAEAIRVTARPAPLVTGLEALLARYGFEIDAALAFDAGSGRQRLASIQDSRNKRILGPNPFALKLEGALLARDEAATRSLPGLSFPDVCPLKVSARGGQVSVLARASPTAVARRELRGMGRVIRDFASAQDRPEPEPSGQDLPLALIYRGPLESPFAGLPPPAAEGDVLGSAGAQRSVLDATERASLALIGDVSFLEGGTWSRYPRGREAYVHGLTFLVNLIDQLSGDEDLIPLRSRGLRSRTWKLPRGTTRLGASAPVYLIPPLALIALALLRSFLGRRRGARIAEELRQCLNREKRP